MIPDISPLHPKLVWHHLRHHPEMGIAVAGFAVAIGIFTVQLWGEHGIWGLVASLSLGLVCAMVGYVLRDLHAWHEKGLALEREEEYGRILQEYKRLAQMAVLEVKEPLEVSCQSCGWSEIAPSGVGIQQRIDQHNEVCPNPNVAGGLATNEYRVSRLLQ